MNKQEIKIQVAEESVSGTLLLTDGIWAFSSVDPQFMRIYPAGMTYSFSQADSEAEKTFKQEITEVYNALKSEEV